MELDKYALNMYYMRMPLVLQLCELKFYIYFHDHGPPHIHVLHPRGELKVDIETRRILSNRGFNSRLIRFALTTIENREQDFMEKWNEYKKD